MDILISDSKINGKGVFANRDFKKGEIILKWKPTKLKKSEISKFDKRYILIDDKGQYYLMNPPERYINHSCSPNCYTEVDNQRDITLRNIKKGEEITTTYSKDPFNEKMKCNCGSENCKGLI
jgi:SET domain-containing protein